MNAGIDMDRLVTTKLFTGKIYKANALDTPPSEHYVDYGYVIKHFQLHPGNRGPWKSADWRPSTNIEDAWAVVTKIASLGWWWEIQSPFSPQPGPGQEVVWYAGCSPWSTTGWNGRPDHRASGATAAEAICRCALKVVERGDELDPIGETD